jgi:hypothetical protein
MASGSGVSAAHALASEPDSISIASAVLLRALFLGSDMLTFVHVETSKNN